MAHPSAIHIEKLLVHSQWLQGLALHLVGDVHEADDVVQATWQAALESGPRNETSLKGWLGMVARRVVIRRRAQGQSRSRRERQIASADALPATDDLIAIADQQRHLVQMVTELPEPGRSTVLLHFFKGLSPTEIAKRQGVPASTVRNRLKRALDSMRDRLDQDHEGDRRQWMLGLIPIASDPYGSPGSPSLSRSSPQGSSAGQSASHSISLNGVSVVVLTMASIVGVWLVTKDSTSNLSETPTTTLSARGGETSSATTPEVPTSVPKRVASSTPSPTYESHPRSYGLVIDNRGRPITNVQVVAESNNVPSRMIAQTEEEGVFQWESAEDEHRLLVRDPNWVTVLAGSPQRGSSDWPTTIVVARRRPLQGQVRDPKGHEISGAVISLSAPTALRAQLGAVLDASSDEQWEGSTDTLGRFQIASAPQLPEIEVACRAIGYAEWRGVVASDTIAITLQPLGIAGELEIHGRVVNSRGKPVSGARVSAVQRDASTDAFGAFQLTLPTPLPEGARLVAIAEGHGLAISEDTSSWLSSVTLRLRPQAQYRGRVISHTGAPIEAAMVQIMPKLFGGGQRVTVKRTPTVAGGPRTRTPVGPALVLKSASTESDGSFRIDGPELHAVTAVALDPKTLLRGEVSVDRDRDSIEIALPDAALRDIHGTLVDDRGAPIVGAEVSARRRVHSGSSPVASISLGNRKAITNDEGHFLFRDIAPDRIDLTAHVAGAMPLSTTVEDHATSITLRTIRAGHVRIVVAGRGDAVAFLDREGNVVPASSMEGDRIRTRVIRVALHDGRSSVQRVPLHVTAVAVFDGERELRRVSVTIAPDQLNVLQL